MLFQPKRETAATVMARWLLVGILCASAAGTAGAADLLPNLKPYPASDIRVSYENGRKLLRFTATTWNNGQGPLDLRGGEKIEGKQVVRQRIFQDTGTYRDVLAGTFTWHEAHQHIHFDGFARYDLKPVTVSSSGKSSEKTTFCVMDVSRIARLPGAPKKARYRTCDTQVQGMSVGWADIYRYYLAGQYFDITDTPYGDYDIQITADPNQRLVESQEGSDNVSVVRVRISDGGATVVSPTS